MKRRWPLVVSIMSLAGIFLAFTLTAAGDGDKKPEAKPPALAPAADKAGDLSGYYLCSGSEAGGKRYSGIVSIARVQQLYIVTWLVGSGTPFQGVGVRQGDTLAVSWSTPRPGGLVQGCNVYRIDDGGKKMAGRWAAVPGAGTLQNETLTFLRELGTDPDD